MCFAVEQIVEPMRAATSGRALPSGSTGHSSGRRQEQPGEAQQAPFSDLPVHGGRGWRLLAMLERFRRGLEVNPAGQRLVVDATRAGGSAGPAVDQREARGTHW